MTHHSDTLKSLAQEAQARAADLRDWFDPGCDIRSTLASAIAMSTRALSGGRPRRSYRDLGPEARTPTSHRCC